MLSGGIAGLRKVAANKKTALMEIQNGTIVTSKLPADQETNGGDNVLDKSCFESI